VGIPGTLLLERYRVVRPIAFGASSVVYLAFDEFGGPFAVKLFPPSLASRADREFLVGHGLNHPNLNPVIERVTLEGQPGVLMPFAPGKRLSDAVQESGNRIFMQAFVQLLRALDAMHARHMVHRDVKPENLIVSPGENNSLEVKLIDYDLSGPDGEVFRERVTPGTVAYLSPEAAQGLPLTPSSDLYSVGVLLFWGLTGQLPFEGETRREVMQAHIGSFPPVPRTLRPDWQEHPLDDVALRLLEKDPKNRYPNVKAVLHELECLPDHARTLLPISG
jgi:eukaryotic-like serine/threonine-protein kinase